MNRRDILKMLGVSPAIPAVQAIEQLHIGSGDSIVLKFKERLTCEAGARIRETWISRYPDVPLILLDNGADIQVLRQK